MAKIFISYSRDSRDLVEELVQDLKDDDHETWFDQRLTGGQSWWDKILSEIRICDIFVAALTPDSLESLACQRELKYADLLQKPLCPVRLSDKVRPEALPHRLAESQWVDYCHPDKLELKNLQRRIRGLPKAPPLPDPLPNPPSVPISYLSTLREQIETDSKLTPKDQSKLVFELRSHFQDDGRAEEIIDLLQRLKRRRGLFAKVSRDIDELQGDIDRAQRGSPSNNEREPLREPASSPSVPASDPSKQDGKDQMRTAKSDNGREPVTDIFISYSNSDRAHAMALAEALEQEGWSVWWDREIPIGSAWDEVIEEEISKARSILVLWSSSSVASDWVKNEARDGIARRILLPALIEPTMPPFEFRHIQTADLTAWKRGEPNAEFDRLLKRLHRLLDQSETIPSPQRQRGSPSRKGHIVSNDTPEEDSEGPVPNLGGEIELDRAAAECKRLLERVLNKGECWEFEIDPKNRFIVKLDASAATPCIMANACLVYTIGGAKAAELKKLGWTVDPGDRVKSALVGAAVFLAPYLFGRNAAPLLSHSVRDTVKQLEATRSWIVASPKDAVIDAATDLILALRSVAPNAKTVTVRRPEA